MSDVGAGHDVNYIGRAQANNIVINSGDHFHTGAATESKTVRQDVFRASFQAPANPREVILDFGNPLDGTEPQTQEATVLYELLRVDCNPSEARVVAVHGKGGVGKSCILRALARNEQLKEQFPDGIYFLSLGMDAGMGTLIQGLAKIARLSGGNVLGAELCGEDNFEIAVQKVREWMNGKTSLLLVDDFWEENGLGAHVVTELAQMFSNGSMVVVTTRFSGVTTKGNKMVEIKQLEMMSDKAKDILLEYSKFDWEEVDQDHVRAAFIKLLKMCGGLPVFLAIVGKAVAKISLRFMCKKERGPAWEECLSMLEDSELLETKVDNYKDLGRTLHMSLNLLSEDCGKVIERLSSYSLGEMHRAFCVFKKQAAIPLSVCRRLWKVESDSEALKIGMAFADVGLADIEIEKKGGRHVKVVRLHDLVHIFAVECAKEKNEVARWHDRLLEGYISEEDADSVRLLPGVENEHDGVEYMFENLCRHLASGSKLKYLVMLLMSVEWTWLRHQCGGLPAWKRDFSEYLGRKMTEALTQDEKETERGLRMIRDAVVESWVFVRENRQELGYQIFGRLVDCENELVRKYLGSVEKVQRESWLKPMQRCFARPGEGGMTAEFKFEHDFSASAVQKKPFIAVAAAGEMVAFLDLERMTVRNRRIHAGKAFQVGINDDGNRAFFLFDDCTIGQWDIQSDREDTDKYVRLHDEERGEDDWISCAAFCPVKNNVITGSVKGRVKIWDLCTGERIGRTMDASERVKCIGMSPCGRIIAAGVDGLALRLWDMQTGTPLREELKGDYEIVSSIAFSPDGRLVASCGLNHGEDLIRLWGLENRTQIGDPFAICICPPYRITFSEDAQQIVSGHLDGSIVVWDVASGESIGSWKAHSNVVMFMTVIGAVDSRCVVSVGGDRTVRMWDLQAVVSVRDEPVQHDEDVIGVAATPDGRFFLSDSVDETLRIWDGSNGTPVGGVHCPRELGITCVAVSTGDERLVSGSWDGKLRLWDVATGAQVGDTLPGHDDCMTHVAYRADGRFVVSCFEDGTVQVWRVIDHPQSDGCVHHQHTSNRASLAGPGVPLSLSNQKPLCLAMTVKLKLPYAKWMREHKVSCVAVSPSGQRVLSGALGEIWVWDASSGECIYQTVVVSPAGHGMLSLNEGILFDAHSGEIMYRTYADNESEIVRIEISESNEVVTTNELYEEVRWELDDDGSLMRVQEHEDETGVAEVESQGLVSQGPSSIVCRGRSVEMNGSGKKIGTLPDDVPHKAWKYNAKHGVLCVGLRDGRVLFFQVEHGPMHVAQLVQSEGTEETED